MITSMRARVNRSTMSKKRLQGQNTTKGIDLPTSASNLKQVVFLKFLEHAAFDFDKLVGDEKGE
jgi:hypothetical protein